MRARWVYSWLLVLFLTSGLATLAQEKPANVSGRWQLSWEARIGTERGTMQLEQTGSKVSGDYRGQLGSSKIWGTVEGNKVGLTLEFQRAHPFTISFTGTSAGDRMEGKFEIEGVKDGYDWHGENARPTNYSWTALRRPDQTQSNSSQSPQGLMLAK